MTGTAFRLLCIGAAAPTGAGRGGFEITEVLDPAEASHHLHDADSFDAVLVDGDRAAADFEPESIGPHAALIVVVVEPDTGPAAGWLHRGADDVIGRDELSAASTARRIRFAVERHRRDAGRTPSYSTDPGTGLPHRQQLVEHLSQLLALREREPAPMAVVVLRIEGLEPAVDAEPHGADRDAVRRKLAVRLRAAVRASDVVASIDACSFAVLLGSILAPSDAERVAGKLGAVLIAPVAVGGIERAVAVAVGIARYPQDGKDGERLLRRASALAAVAPASGNAGPTTVRDARGGARIAANDEGA